MRLRNSWELGKISWSVLRSDRTLGWFPVWSALASLVVVVVVGGLVAATGVDSSSGSEGLEGIGYVLIGIGVLALSFVGSYFAAALVAAANARLDGQETSVGTACRAANAKLHVILPWAIVQGIVSILLSAVESRAGWLGDVVVRMLGAAWSVLTFLTIPIIVLEDAGPVQALKRSGTLLKATWGENLAAQVGFGLLALVAALPGVALIGIGVATGSVVVAVALGLVGVAWLVAVSIVIAAMNGIYRTALYRYAVDGRAPAAFAGADLGGAFGPRRSPRRGLR